jgi:hypothetical protein
MRMRMLRKAPSYILHGESFQDPLFLASCLKWSFLHLGQEARNSGTCKSSRSPNLGDNDCNNYHFYILS